VSLLDVDGRLVLGVDVEGGAEQDCRSDYVDLSAPADAPAQPRGTSGADSAECFWSCVGEETLITSTADFVCDICFDNLDRYSCSVCAALLGAQGALCLNRCGLPGGGGSSGDDDNPSPPTGTGSGCAGAGFTLFPSLCH
jgi:hypothetical protein